MINPILIFVIIAVIAACYNRGYFKGLNASVFFLLLSPYNIFLPLPGELPNLTVHRIIIIVMFLVWMGRRSRAKRESVPFVKGFYLVIITAVFSTVFSLVLVQSVKTVLSVIIEQFVFYLVVQSSFSSLRGEELKKEAYGLLMSVSAAFAIVAFFGIVERWTDFNPVDLLPTHVEVPSFLQGQLFEYHGRVKSFYPDPILLGYGLSMAWPLLLIKMGALKKGLTKNLLLISFLLIGSCLYFTESRGPWISSILAGLILFSLGTSKMRKKVIFAGLLLVFTFVVRPQVATTILNLAKSTTDLTDLKGRSFNYRIELWGKAYREISRSPLRLVIGYGDKSHEFVDWSGYETNTGRFSYFWSWDNEYAAVLLDRGFVGLFAFAALYLLIAFYTFKKYRYVPPEYKDLYSALFAGIIIFIFMMTNVLVFSPQLILLFWTVVALAVNIGNEAHTEAKARRASTRQAVGYTPVRAQEC